MGDDYFGYRYVPLPMYAGVSDDYLEIDHSDPNRVYDPTSYDNVDIETMWRWVQKQSDERAGSLADMWRRVSTLLQSTRDNLHRHADALAAAWTSPAGELFMRKVGAAIYSLDQWREAADNNARGLDLIRDRIKSTQEEFIPLYENYLAEQRAQEAKRSADEGIQLGDLFGINNGKTIDEVKEEFHERAKNLVKPLGDMFVDTYLDYISRGTTYQGPTNAVVTYPGDVPTPVPPLAGPGAPPGPPGGLGGGAGPAPTRPDLTGSELTGSPRPPGAPPPLPDGVGLAGGTVAPPAPGPAPAAPQVTPPAASPPPGPVVPPVPPPAARPGTPLTPQATRPTAPGTRPATRPAAPPRPTLPGVSGPGGGAGPAAPGSARKGAPPARPTLPGTSGAPGTPGRPAAPGSGRAAGRGAAPGAPQLPGSTAGRPARPGGRVGRGPVPPPSLGGSSGSVPPGGAARPGAGGRPNSPGQPGRPGTPGTGTPAPGGRGTGRASLTGRGGPGAQPPGRGAGPAPALGGRRGETPRARPTRTGDTEPDTWRYGDGDDELWQTDQAPKGSIDTPDEHRPKDQGRTLGQG